MNSDIEIKNRNRQITFIPLNESFSRKSVDDLRRETTYGDTLW